MALGRFLLTSGAWLFLAQAAAAHQVWVVKQGDRLGPVLAQARPGDTVQVEGIHDEVVRVPAGVTLQGGPGAAIEWPTAPVVRVTGAGAVVSSLLIVAGGKDFASRGVVDIPAGNAEVLACSVRGGAIGLSVEGSAAATVAACVFAGQSQAGVVVADRASAKIGNCRVQPDHAQQAAGEGPEYGLEATGAAVATLEGDRVARTGLFGILFAGESSGSVSASVVHYGLGSGIGLWGHASPTLSHNTLSINRESGIAYFEHAGGLAEANTCSGNKIAGIAVQGEASPSLLADTCAGNGRFGLEYRDRAGGSVRNCKLAHNGIKSLALQDQASPDLGPTSAH